jgi:hypothetical protein
LLQGVKELFSQEQDWMMRQIKAIADAIAALIFGKANVSYRIQDEANHTETDVVFLLLNEMLDNGNINGAEDMLFEKLDPNNTNYLLLAVDFYQRLNDKADDALKRCGFSRDEIEDGLTEVTKIYGIKL